MIAHLDLDSFFVSVEVLNNPSLKGKPVIVGGGERGVVSTCSYEARKYGVHSAMPMKTALRLCPHAIVTSSGRGEYSRYSRWVTDIIAARSPLFEKASIDEFYIDLSGMERFHPPFPWTIALREEIMDKTGLPISFGLASSKMVAKIATGEAKPNGYLHILPGREAEFLAPLKINVIPGVGESFYQQLRDWGLNTIGDLLPWSLEQLEQRFGKTGADLYNKARGQHFSPIAPYHEAKSISTESTFDANRTDVTGMLEDLTRMTEKIAHELRQENKMAGCIAVKIRYSDFETTSRQNSIPYTHYDDELMAQAKELFQKLYRKGAPVRLIGVKLSELTDGATQTNLFADVERKNDLYKAIDQIKNRFGKNSLTKAVGKKPEGN